MWYRNYFANVLNKSLQLRRGYLFVLILFLSSFASVFAATAPSDSDEIKKLIKDANRLTRAGLVTDAEAILRRAVALDDKRTDAKIELSYVLVKERRLIEAYDLCYPIVQADPKNARALAVLGTTLIAGGRFRDARTILFAAIQQDRTQDLAWAGYGMLDFYENKINNSLENLKEAVYYAPDEPDYIFALAQVSARSERYKEAADAYNQFLNISKSTDTDRRARIKGLIIFLRYLGQYGSLYVSSGPDQMTVPFDLVGNRPVVKLKLNGSEESLKFVLDTGSGITVISEETAQRLKIRAIARGGYARGIGGRLGQGRRGEEQ